MGDIMVDTVIDKAGNILGHIDPINAVGRHLRVFTPTGEMFYDWGLRVPQTMIPVECAEDSWMKYDDSPQPVECILATEETAKFLPGFVKCERDN